MEKFDHFKTSVGQFCIL